MHRSQLIAALKSLAAGEAPEGVAVSEVATAAVKMIEGNCGLPQEVADRIRALAVKQCHQEGVVEVDDGAPLSYIPDQREDGGTYVQVWAWVEFDHEDVIGPEVATDRPKAMAPARGEARAAS